MGPYNAMLSTHWLLDHTEVSVVLDNEAIYAICQKQLDTDRPSYLELNQVIAKVISSMTASLRFDGEANVDLGEFQTNLVPFPRLHFMTTALAPVISQEKASHEAQTVREITDTCFQPKNMLVKYADFDPVEDKYMAISINYRGDIMSKEANSTVQWLKQNNKVSFVEWCPTGFKIGLNGTPAAAVNGDIMADAKKNIVMIGNNVAVSRVFTERITKKYDMMYAQRAFVHWYVGEVWKRANSLRLEKISDSWRRTTWMLFPSRRPMRLTPMRSSNHLDTLSQIQLRKCHPRIHDT